MSNDFGLLSPTYKNMSASGLVKTGTGRIRGVFCNTTSSGSLAFADATSGTTPVIVTGLSLTAGTWYYFGDLTFETGLYITLTNTANWTVVYF